MRLDLKCRGDPRDGDHGAERPFVGEGARLSGMDRDLLAYEFHRRRPTPRLVSFPGAGNQRRPWLVNG